MIDEIDWEHILIKSDEFANEILEEEDTSLCGVPMPREVIRELCRKGLGRADPKNCYE